MRSEPNYILLCRQLLKDVCPQLDKYRQLAPTICKAIDDTRRLHPDDRHPSEPARERWQAIRTALSPHRAFLWEVSGLSKKASRDAAKAGRSDIAAIVRNELLQIKHDLAHVHLNIGIANYYLGQLDDAAKNYRRAIDLTPAAAHPHYNLGNVLRVQGNYAAAEACHRKAVDLKPDFAAAHVQLGADRELQGDFERGLPELEWRLKMEAFKPRDYRRPMWDGSPLHGKTILLAAEGGLGDTFQFIRYAPLLKARGARVLAEVQRPLRQITRTCPGIDEVFTQGDALPDFDTFVMLESLPLLMGTKLDTIPATVPYLFADPQVVDAWRDEITALPGFKVGIAWNASVRDRSLPLPLFEELANVPTVTLVSLQKGRGAEEIEKIASRFNVVNFGARLDGTSGPFMDTVAIMRHLDLVVTCETSLAHLAGAVGARMWVALMSCAEPRWLLNRDDSPWYPTARLFRQTQLDEWPSVFKRMGRALRELITPQ